MPQSPELLAALETQQKRVNETGAQSSTDRSGSSDICSKLPSLLLHFASDAKFPRRSRIVFVEML